MSYQNKRSNRGGRQGGRRNDRRGGHGGGFRRGGGSFSRGESYKATCADCGNNCTVPFKPNGRKPVLCSDCFQGGEQDRPKRDDRRERKSFQKPSERPHVKRQPDNGGVESELKQIRRKLDRVLEILLEVTVVEEDED